MNRNTILHRIRSILAAALLMPASAMASDIEAVSRIESIAIAAVTSQLPPSARVSGGSLDARLRLPACPSGATADPPQLRGASANVAVRCTAPAWMVYVPLRISDPRPVVVTTRAGARGETLALEMLSLQERDVAQLPFGYFESLEATVGLDLRRPVTAGTVLTPNDAEPQRVVRRGQIVTVVSRGGGIEVRASGTAMADGHRGQRIRIRNDSSKRVVEGVVTAAGLVEVAL